MLMTNTMPISKTQLKWLIKEQIQTYKNDTYNQFMQTITSRSPTRNGLKYIINLGSYGTTYTKWPFTYIVRIQFSNDLKTQSLVLHVILCYINQRLKPAHILEWQRHPWRFLIKPLNTHQFGKQWDDRQFIWSRCLSLLQIGDTR